MTFRTNRPKLKGPVKVLISTHPGRIHMAYLCYELLPWRSSTSDVTKIFGGYPVDDDITVDYPNDVDYVIRSQGTDLLYHNRFAPLQNAKIQDPRKHVVEWKTPLTAVQFEALNYTQRNHIAILDQYLYVHYDWLAIPPFVTHDGKLPRYLRGDSSTTLDDITEA